MKRFFCFAVLAILPLLSCSKSSRLEQLVLRGGTMGTSYNIKIVVPHNLSVNPELVHADIKQLLEQVNKVASTYVHESEVSVFNRIGSGEWLNISDDLLELIKTSQHIHALSDGAFDVTVGPLVNLWGFGPEHNRDEIPPVEEIRRRKNMVGSENIIVRDNPPSLKKKMPHLYCDFSAIAKGWGVDKVAELLDDRSFDNYLVEIGGEIRAKGVNLKGGEWRIGVSSPKQSDEIEKVIKVSNVGVATSGDYRNYFEKDGVRYSHTIDPRTGAPITHGLASVTVIHPSCMLADAFATAIDVLGPEKGMMLAREQDLTVFLIVKTKNGFEEQMTPAFQDYIVR